MCNVMERFFNTAGPQKPTDNYTRDPLIDKGLEQTWQYMDTVGSVDGGHLIIFNRTQELSWEERIWHRQHEYLGHPIMVWGM